jgi:hypothetical protein
MGTVEAMPLSEMQDLVFLGIAHLRLLPLIRDRFLSEQVGLLVVVMGVVQMVNMIVVLMKVQLKLLVEQGRRETALEEAAD